jgi:hypothetical protein
VCVLWQGISTFSSARQAHDASKSLGPSVLVRKYRTVFSRRVSPLIQRVSSVVLPSGDIQVLASCKSLSLFHADYCTKMTRKCFCMRTCTLNVANGSHNFIFAQKLPFLLLFSCELSG